MKKLIEGDMDLNDPSIPPRFRDAIEIVDSLLQTPSPDIPVYLKFYSGDVAVVFDVIEDDDNVYPDSDLQKFQSIICCNPGIDAVFYTRPMNTVIPDEMDEQKILEDILSYEGDGVPESIEQLVAHLTEGEAKVSIVASWCTRGDGCFLGIKTKVAEDGDGIMLWDEWKFCFVKHGEEVMNHKNPFVLAKELNDRISERKDK